MEYTANQLGQVFTDIFRLEFKLSKHFVILRGLF